MKIPILLLRTCLVPIAILYGLIIQIRNFLYDWGIFKIYRFRTPVISVGNITAGGTGKTPLVIHLVNILSGYYKHIAIISRGYGRKSKGIQVVSDGVTKGDNTDLYGDEPCLIAQHLDDAIVVVSESRVHALNFIEKNQALRMRK